LPPVLLRSFWLQPPSGPREGCDEFHDLDAASSRKPLRSAWPTMAAPWVLLVQLRQGLSSPAGNARPSICEPGKTSGALGGEPTPATMVPRSVSDTGLPGLLVAPWGSSAIW